MLAFHRYAQLFPLMLDGERAEQRESIRTNGLREPIDILEEEVLDGRNRYLCLLDLVSSAEPRGKGWGVYAGTPLTADDLVPGDGNPLFCRYSGLEFGDPLEYVIDKNLPRRHLTDDQRRMVAAKLVTMGRGRPSLNAADCGINREDAARRLSTDEAGVERARTVLNRGVDELQQAVEHGDLSVNAASQIARRPEEDQRADLQRRGIINGDRSLMASRQELRDSLDYFPTPPWATRALFERVFPHIDVDTETFNAAWEPACGEGHIAEVLREYFDDVASSDVFPYGYHDARVINFLASDETPGVGADWIITNPPFGDNAEAFVLRALERADIGVAMFFRLQWLETIGRFERIFRPYPPAVIAQFAERVPLHKGRWEPDGSTATAYLWIVWFKDQVDRHTEFFWIPPGCKDSLTKPGDRERFTAHPVLPIGQTADGTKFDPSTGEINPEEADGGKDVTAPDQTTREQAEAGELSASGDDPASDFAKATPDTSDPFDSLNFDKPGFPSFLRHDSPERKALPEKRGC